VLIMGRCVRHADMIRDTPMPEALRRMINFE
jgi:hypothetical protein